jgi:hypothetical protein
LPDGACDAIIVPRACVFDGARHSGPVLFESAAHEEGRQQW